MPRPDLSDERRREFLPVIARAFAEQGYRRMTTAALAERCGVQETVLYRLWDSKQKMFIAAIRFVFDSSAATWERVLKASPGQAASPAERLLAYEARHHGEFGHYRIVFAGLSETDDPAIRTALAEMYRRFQAFVARQIEAQGAGAAEAGTLAWGLIGLGTVASITRELRLLGEEQRIKLMSAVGRALLAPLDGGGRSA